MTKNSGHVSKPRRPRSLSESENHVRQTSRCTLARGFLTWELEYVLSSRDAAVVMIRFGFTDGSYCFQCSGIGHAHLIATIASST